jgi:hypothetical protein
MCLPPTVQPDAAEPTGVEAFILAVGVGGVEAAAPEIIESMLGCDFPMLLIEANCRNSTKGKKL